VRWSLLACIYILALPGPAFSQLDQLTGLGGLQEVELGALTQQDENPLGRIALALHPDDWKHAEGEHFIYHYVRSFVASRAAVEAEFNYRVVTKELEKAELTDGRKSHLYIFDRPEDWHEFQKEGVLDAWTGGIHSAGSLFLLRDPAYKFSNNILGHEIAHLVVYRYYGSHIPCWLSEGFAEYVSRNSLASYQRARGYIMKPYSQSIAPGSSIPLQNLLRMPRPPAQSVHTFYNESERLVRFLATSDKARFLTLLDDLAHAEPFDDAFPRVYAGIFANRNDFEQKFTEYLSKDYGTTLQD
jgi:hypothetical protein